RRRLPGHSRRRSRLDHLSIAGSIDSDVVPFATYPLALGPPSNKHRRVIDRVQKRFRLKLEGPISDRGDLYEAPASREALSSSYRSAWRHDPSTSSGSPRAPSKWAASSRRA